MTIPKHYAQRRRGMVSVCVCHWIAKAKCNRNRMNIVAFASYCREYYHNRYRLAFFNSSISPLHQVDFAHWVSIVLKQFAIHLRGSCLLFIFVVRWGHDSTPTPRGMRCRGATCFARFHSHPFSTAARTSQSSPLWHRYALTIHVCIHDIWMLSRWLYFYFDDVCCFCTMLVFISPSLQGQSPDICRGATLSALDAVE